MSWFAVALFIHIAGVLILFAAQALEMAGVIMLRRAASVAQVRDAGFILGNLDTFFGLSSALIFLSGIYLLVVRAEKHQSIGWVFVALVLFILMAAFGTISGKRTGEQMARLAGGSKRTMTEDLRTFTRSNPAQVSVVMGMFAVLGILALMVFHPSVLVSIVVLVVALAAGWLVLARLGFYQMPPRVRRAHA